MYILGLCSSCGTSQICPAWSSSEHLLAPALSPFGARVRSHAVQRRLLEEVVYILNDRCSHFTQRLFPLRVPQHTSLLLTVNTIHRISFMLIIYHIHTYIYIFIYMSCSQLHFSQFVSVTLLVFTS